jgi:hypothetical protein
MISSGVCVMVNNTKEYDVLRFNDNIVVPSLSEAMVWYLYRPLSESVRIQVRRNSLDNLTVVSNPRLDGQTIKALRALLL